ncbi:MAG: ParB/RepB/Spo0J family partition protein [Pseudomonadota bacterium]|nr:ParB/RepB/Spo0J family partition protein [Pseudomonadota bacterium]
MTKPAKGLGRGLDSLLGADFAPGVQPDELPQSLPIDSMRPGKFQPRTGMDAQALSELAESIKAQGILQPVLVRPVGAGQYEIIAGERRWRAARIAGLTSVPVAVRDIPDDAALSAALIENIQRENLNPLEEATGIVRLIDEFKMTHEVAGKAVGRSRTAVTNLLRLLNLAQPVRELLLANQIDMGHARALLVLSNAKQAEIAHHVVKARLSVRQTEALVARSQNAKTNAVVSANRDVLRLQEELADRLGSAVQIRASKSGKGSIKLSFQNLAELDRILVKLKQ